MTTPHVAQPWPRARNPLDYRMADTRDIAEIERAFAALVTRLDALERRLAELAREDRA